MTDGGTDPTNERAGAPAPWPPAPPGAWGADAGHAPPPSTERRRGWVGLAVVIVLTGAIVAIAFTVLGGESDESAGRKFMPVGESIDGSAFESSGDPFDTSGSFDSGSFDTIPMDDGEPIEVEEGLALLLPDDDDVASLGTEWASDVDLYGEAAEEPGSVRSYCLDDGGVGTVDTDGSHVRIWTSNRNQVEVSVRVSDMGDEGTARTAIALRQTDEFATCAPTQVEASTLDYVMDGGEVADQRTVADGQQLEQVLSIESRWGCHAVLAWRQVEQYVVSAKVFDCDPQPDLAIDATDDLLDAATERITG